MGIKGVALVGGYIRKSSASISPVTAVEAVGTYRGGKLKKGEARKIQSGNKAPGHGSGGNGGVFSYDLPGKAKFLAPGNRCSGGFRGDATTCLAQN